jgi:ligand-binding sensor domain-containing protein/class 3 adenylate cyclase
MYKYFLFLSLIMMLSCTHKEQENTSATLNSEERQDSLTPLRGKVIAGLPDSLQPKTIFLDKAPGPLTVKVPKSCGGSYTVFNSKGEKLAVNLEPPVSRFPAVLKNAKGEPVMDKDGNPVIMGDGGISNFRTFTTDNGLTLDGVSCSLMDRAGNLWFGTYGGGVSRYDGNSFSTFTSAQGLANNSVSSIAEDKSGNLWFGTFGGGVSRYDGKTFCTFTSAQGLANNTVFCIAEDRSGNLWFGTNGGGVSRYDRKSFRNLTKAQGLANNTVLCIAEDRSGNLWFGTYRGGVSRYDGKTFHTFTKADGLADNSVSSTVKDKSGNLWFGTYDGGVSRYDGKNFLTFSSAQGLASNSVSCIAEDKSGNLWFGTNGCGVSRYDGKSFNTFTTSQGLSNNSVLCITEDKSGNLWFGTNGGGVSRYEGKAFLSYTSVQGLAKNSIYCIAEDRSGNLWFGTYGGGVSRYDGKSFTTFTTAQGLANNRVLSILQDRSGNIWFGTVDGGVSRYDGKSFCTFNTAQGLANNSVFFIREDRSGNLWFGTNDGGVSRYDGHSFQTFTTSQGLTSNIVLSIAEDKSGNLWFGTKGGGISYYNGNSFCNFTCTQGPANYSVYCISVDKSGNLWFGTSKGVTFLSADEVLKLSQMNDNDQCQDSLSKIIFRTFTTKDGLPDNFVTQVIQLPGGKMAVGTNLGITFFDPAPEPSGNFTTLSGIEIYNSVTGYPVKDVNTGQNCMYADSKGAIWAATGSETTALVRFDPSSLYRDTQPPTLVLLGIKVNNENICWNNLRKDTEERSENQTGSSGIITSPNITEEVTTLGRVLAEADRDSMRQRFSGIGFDSIARFYPVPENLILPYRHNNITIEFGAIEVARPNRVQYQYYLEGYDKEWSPVMKKTSASFGNIPEGTYTFKVKAQGPNGIWSEVVTYTFKVIPPWYRKWWSYLFYAIITLGTIILIFRWRTAALRKDREILEKTVKERTSEVVAEKREVEKQKLRSDELLLNILPVEVADELKQTGHCKAKTFSMVTVMFADFKDFTHVSEKVSAELLVDEINYCFSAFDEILQKHDVEKIKTVGDAYICASGLPVLSYTHAMDMVTTAIEIRDFMITRKKEKENRGEIPFQLRIGIHTGPVVAGIVGVKKFQYDIWGDTVNLAARMESSGEAGQVNISGTTYELVKDKFNCSYRGKIQAKNKGEIDMYFVDGIG